MLLVVNPFKDLKLTTTEKVMQYRAMDKDIVTTAALVILRGSLPAVSSRGDAVHQGIHVETSWNFLMKSDGVA